MRSSIFWRSGAQAAWVLLAAGSLIGCGDKAGLPSGGPFYEPPGTTTTTTALCAPARSSEPLVPRIDITGMSASAVGGQDVAYTSDLIDRFYSLCGGCHVDASRGDHHIKKNDLDAFIAGFDGTWIATIKLEDPALAMPQPGRPWSERLKTPEDPVVAFVNYANAWLAAGKPRTVFAIDNGSSGAPASSKADYGFTSSVAAALTNIGNCIPNAAMFASSTSGIMTSLDDEFAAMTALPNTLAETDLTSLDSEELAKTAVIAYAPTYALWSAGSGKLRHIRVPRGTSVKFDKATQTFTLPENTRFYKTFLRAVRDRTGETRWRKMETRVIVARSDDVDPSTGAARQNALFGTYVWSEDETTATLASQPYRDQTPWKDIVRSYIKDELLYQNILDSTTGSVDGAVALAIQQHKDDPDYRDLFQHYAIPGQKRCVQCHMGSATKDFVLGFLPLQVARRATGTGGTYDRTGPDELTQLQRMIDLGVISGITSLDDVKPLEESQGARKPRKTASVDGDVVTDDGELKAQAYMLGNCAHCHNPRGFPSISKPELAPMLNFLPDAKDGGIFQFPLERTSPIRARGANADVPIPYITPSLRDYPVTAGGGTRLDNGKNVVGATETGASTYTPKFLISATGAGNVMTCKEALASGGEEERAFCGDKPTGTTFVAAPWRSLIYRNVDTPAAYFDDFVPFPHMPMNTAGFDCRAPRIMGDWMVGLPSKRKLEQLAKLLGTDVKAPSEDAIPTAAPNEGNDGRPKIAGAISTGYDDNPQPYFEVPPDSDFYGQALAEARARLVEYHDGIRYQYCQDVLSPDIFDRFVAQHSAYPYHPNPDQFQLTYIENPPEDPQHPGSYVQPRMGVPFHVHWIDYDPTDPAGDWAPRRTEWKDVLVDRVPDTAVAVGVELTDDIERSREILVQALNDTPLSDQVVKYAITEQPFGLWKVKPGCEQKLASVPKVSGLASKPAWVDISAAPADAPVYMMSPGASIFRHICINCHGPNADGKGLQVDLLAAASEGEARPANFRGGLFGPEAQPLSNLTAVFDIMQSGNVDVASLWASRYMAWMALGGTTKRIPQDIIQLVAATPTLGYARPSRSLIPGADDATGNMLNLAKGLCAFVLPSPIDGLYGYQHAALTKGKKDIYPPYDVDNGPFIDKTYDKEMWLHLCSDYAPQVIRVYGALAPTAEQLDLVAMYYAKDSDPSRSFPTDAPVWDHTWHMQPRLSPDNFYPACVDPRLPTKSVKVDVPLPPCPVDFLTKGKVLWRNDGTVGALNVATHGNLPPDDKDAMADNVTTWKLKGAIATGMSVFSYLRDRLSKGTHLAPYYDQCELLP
jgi:mono/diheme cytochrome c family protein